MFYSTIAQSFLVALLAITTLCLIRGDGWSRTSALLHLTNFLLVSAFSDHRPHAFQTADLGIDVAGVLLATAIAMRSGRLWAGCLAAFQAVAIGNYFTRLLDPAIHRQVFVATFYVWEVGAEFCLVWSAAGGRPSRRATDSYDEHALSG